MTFTLLRSYLYEMLIFSNLFAISVVASESNPPPHLLPGGKEERGLNRPPPMRLGNRTKGMAMHLPPHYHSRRTTPPTLSSFSHLSPTYLALRSLLRKDFLSFRPVLAPVCGYLAPVRHSIFFASFILSHHHTDCFSACCTGCLQEIE